MEKYKSEVDRKFRQLKEQREDVEAAFKEGFIGTAEEICGPTSGKPTQSQKNGGGTRKLNKQYKKRRRH